VEATAKKTRFLRHVVGLLDLKDVHIITGRAEDIARDKNHRERYDVAVARAVAPLASLVELTLPFCRVGGTCIAPKKGDIKDELAAASTAIKILGGRLTDVKPVKVEGENDDRCLVMIAKIRNTPGEYPRRPGIPARRPLL
jgi:16S rRNA (guanine527-N7)-methyltransferase